MIEGWHLAEASPDCVKLIDGDGHVLAMNRNGLCAMEIDDFSCVGGASWKSMWPGESHAEIDRALAAARSGGTGSFRAHCPTAKGTSKWWDVIVTAATGAALPGAFLAISRDITATREAERRLQASEARFRSLVTATSAIVWTCTPDGAFDDEQADWAAFTGQDANAYRGAGWLDAVHPDDRAATRAAWERARAARAVLHVEQRLRRADGAYRTMAVKCVPIVDAASALVEWIGTHTDITEDVQTRAERERLLREVRAAGERLGDVIERAPAFICVLRGPDLVFELVNDRYRQLVGQRDLIGRRVADALPEVAGQGFFELLDRVYRTGEPFVGADLPFKLQRMPGMPLEECVHDVAYTALRDADGAVTGVLVLGVDQTRRSRVEAAREADRARLQVATEAAELGLWTWYPDEDAIVWDNARSCEILGLAPAARLAQASRTAGRCLHPLDLARFEHAVALTRDTGARFAFEGRVQHADGAVRWIECSGRVREREGKDDGQAPRRVVGTIADVTARRLVDLELYASRERFETIVSQAAIGVVEMDMAGRITFVNRKYADLLGYAPDELVGRSVADVTAPDSLTATLHTVAGLREDGGSGHGGAAAFDKRYLHRDGMPVPATSSVSVLRGPGGKPQGLVAIVLDTSERERAAGELHASEERYRTLFESMDQGFCIVDMIFDDDGKPVDYRFIEMNRMFERHTGLAGAAGKTARELVPDLDAFWFDTYGRVALTGEPVRFESGSDAMRRWFDVYATRLGEAGTRVAILFSDISARRLADDTLRRQADDLAAADRRKTEFLATLAHELRNPLAPIRSGLDVVRLRGGDPAVVARVHEMMARQVGHMVHLIDDLLDVARINGGKLELKRGLTDLNGVLRAAVETSQPIVDKGRHALHVDLPAAPVMADVDATRIAQVVANLLNNAAKYTPAGGTIRLALRRDGGDALITVADDGVGLAPEAIAGIFDMFTQVGRNLDRAQGGLGIGLSLVRSLVDMHGGGVTADSAGEGRGSTFRVRLPLAQAQAPSASAPDDAADADGVPGAGGALKVLVADDNRDAAAALAMVLETCGHTVRTAHDGVEALAIAQAFEPRLAFIDIGMPRLNGYDTARAMRNLAGPDAMRLVALTGWGADADRLASREAGFDVHLTKPVQLGDIERILAGIGPG